MQALSSADIAANDADERTGTEFAQNNRSTIFNASVSKMQCKGLFCPQESNVPLPLSQFIVESPAQLANGFTEFQENFDSIEVVGEFAELFQHLTDETEVSLVVPDGTNGLIEQLNKYDEYDLELSAHALTIQFLDSTTTIESSEANRSDLILDIPVANRLLGQTIEPTRATTIASTENAITTTTETVAQQTVRALQTDLISFQKSANQSITVEVDPPELGRINIQVEVVADHLAAQIVASEFVSAELLIRQKQHLIDALAEFGFGETTVDISHGSLSDQSERQEQGEPDSNGTILSFDSHSGLVDLDESVVLVGLNLVA